MAKKEGGDAGGPAWRLGKIGIKANCEYWVWFPDEGTAGRKYKGGTAWNLNEEQEDVQHGYYRKKEKESITDNDAKIGQDLESKAGTSAPLSADQGLAIFFFL